jgi:hypothetical protein
LHSSSHIFQGPLQSTHAVLLVNVPVALLLLPVLENHGDAENQDCVDANNAKGSGEDEIQITIGERRELGNASAFLRSNKRIDTGAILDEWW